jgi:hypothetical protein
MADRATRGGIALLVAIAAAGCASTPIALYEGPPREQSEIAVIRRSASRADLKVFRVDARDTRGMEWHVAPGPHRVWVELKLYGEAMNVSFTAWTYCSIDFEAEAGGTYRILSENDQRRQAVDTEVTLGVRLVDANDDLVGALSGCYDRRPAFATP